MHQYFFHCDLLKTLWHCPASVSLFGEYPASGIAGPEGKDSVRCAGRELALVPLSRVSVAFSILSNKAK